MITIFLLIIAIVAVYHTLHKKKTHLHQKIVPQNGMKAYEEGFKLSDNPFKQHTPDHSIWRDDWLFCAGRFR